jgi:hypothetical protein
MLLLLLLLLLPLLLLLLEEPVDATTVMISSGRRACGHRGQNGTTNVVVGLRRERYLAITGVAVIITCGP